MTQKEFNGMFALAMKDFISSMAGKQPGNWSTKERKWAEENKIIHGVSENNYQYASYCTREQMVVFLHRLYELVDEKR